MHRISLLAVLLVISTGCNLAPSPRRGGGDYAGDTDGEGPSPHQTLKKLDGHLRGEGFTPTGPAVRNDAMPEKGVVAYTIDARAGECFVAFALGEEGTDLNLILLEPWGQTVGYDVSPSPHPWVAHCPAQSGVFTARVQMARGSGEYLYAAYRGPAGRTPNLATFFGAAEAEVERAELDATTRQRLESLDAELARDGFERFEAPHGVVLVQGQDRKFPLNLQEDTCYAFATLAGPDVADTDVFVVDGAGNELARDATDSRDGVTQFCPPTTGSYGLRARLYQGRGPVFVAGYAKNVDDAQQATPEPQQPLIEEESVAGAGLEENFRLLDSDMQARGYRSYGEPSRGRLAQAQVRDFDIQLEGGKCYAILAVGDNGVRDLDLILLGPDGNALDRDIEEDARPVVRVCPDASGQFTMRVQMLRGSGNFIYAPYRWPRGTRGPFGLAGIMYVRLAEVTSLLDAEGFAPSTDFTPGKGEVAKGGSETHTLELEGGSCYTVLVVGGEGVNDLDLSLKDGRTQVATDGTRNAFPSVRHCPDRSGRYRLEVEAENGAGKYFYQVFTRASQ